MASRLGDLYEGQLDAVLDVFKAIEAGKDADALMRLRYTSPLRAYPDVEDWHGKATQTP